MPRLLAALAILLAAAPLTACAPATDTVTVSVRLWDAQVADAYETSFRAFEQQHPGIDVEVNVVPWADYWSKLRADLASGNADDVFWTNAGNFVEYERAGLLVDVSDLAKQNAGAWDEDVVEQYTADGKLWGVPQLTDPGIGLFYNADLLAEAGVSVEQVQSLRWDPNGADDTLRAVARTLTRDQAGRSAGDPAFDPSRVRSFGYNASNDLNAITLNYLGSNGAAWQNGDEFVFDSPEGREAMQYVVDLINVDRVAPPAADTNPPAGGDVARDLFLQGKLALFQTGAYNLANIDEAATFDWGIARLPAGPAGAVSVTNGIIAAGASHSARPDAQREVLDWLGSAEGARPLGEDGSAMPAVLDAQDAYFHHWAIKQIDIAPLIDVLVGRTVQAPSGARYSAAQEAYQPILNDIFTGRIPVARGLSEAAIAANAAVR